MVSVIVTSIVDYLDLDLWLRA